jgi:hypothetical protein
MECIDMHPKIIFHISMWHLLSARIALTGQRTTHFTYEYHADLKKQQGLYYKISTRSAGFSNEIGKTYSISKEELKHDENNNNNGFCACEHAINCGESQTVLKDYQRYFLVHMLGEIQTKDNLQFVSNEMKIEKELTYEEWMDLCTVSVTYWEGEKKTQTVKYVRGERMKYVEYWSNGNIQHIGTRLQMMEFSENGELYYLKKWDNGRFVTYTDAASVTEALS